VEIYFLLVCALMCHLIAHLEDFFVAAMADAVVLLPGNGHEPISTQRARSIEWWWCGDGGRSKHRHL